MDYKKLAQEQEAYVIAMRREIHRFPEVAGNEKRTMARICEELEKMGIPYVNVPKGGIFGFLGDEKRGRTVLLRADIDALPGKESPVNGGGKLKETVSEIDGVSHTCGHDCHTAMLLGAAKVFKAHEDEIPGRILLMFERGEECFCPTANLVFLHKWLFDNKVKIDGSFGMHVFPAMPAGTIAVFDGPAMAGQLSFRVKIIGKTAHGSTPQVGISPIDCFVAMYDSIQPLRMKYTSPFNPIVFSVGQVHAGGANNIIPGELYFGGSFRAYDFEDASRVKEQLIKVIEKTAEIYNCQVEYNVSGPDLGLINDPACSALARKKFSQYLGENVLYDVPPMMGSESHSVTAKIWPGTFIGLGIRNEEKGTTALNHHECFDVDEDALKLGVAAHLCYGMEFLKEGPDTSGKVYTGDLRAFYEKYQRQGLVAFED